MGLLSWFRKAPKPPADPLAIYDARIDALSRRAALLRQSAATLLAVRRDLDRQLAALDARTAKALAQKDAAAQAGDLESAAVLGADAHALTLDRDPAALRRERVAGDAEDLAAAVKQVQAEVESLNRERAGAEVALATGQAVVAAQPALADHFDERVALDGARDEVARAHALAEIYRDDARDRAARARD